MSKVLHDFLPSYKSALLAPIEWTGEKPRSRRTLDHLRAFLANHAVRIRPPTVRGSTIREPQKMRLR